ncbi:MAG: efflux RND transporter permease subunit [Alphaproteobacteria bacterium]
MILSDIAIKRPTLASVIAIVIVIFGIVSFDKLPLREYPDIDPPIVTITTDYTGAAANVVETRITQVIEDRISGLEGVKTISSESEDGRSRISIEFIISRDLDAAVNDVRDRVSAVVDNLPDEADIPEVEKVDSSDDVIMWLNLVSDQMDILELTDYARRYLQDKFSIIPGVARVRLGGGLEYSMRIWLDRIKMAARDLTVDDIETALTRQNVELPAGSIDSDDISFSARIKRAFKTEEDFRELVIRRGDDGYLVRLGDIADVRKEAVEDRIFFRGNKVPMIGIGIIKQSKANTIDVAELAKQEAAKINKSLPEGMQILQSYDTSVFIKSSINEVYKTLFIAMLLVVVVIFVFLRNIRAIAIPAVTIPISIVGTFIFLFALDFSINLITLLALVLMIGIVVDDAIIVLENISRRIKNGESPIEAAYLGARQVGFAVIATSLVLISVFVPILFLEGDLGKLFSEFSGAMISAIIISTFIALTLSPMLCSKWLKPASGQKAKKSDHPLIDAATNKYGALLKKLMGRKLVLSCTILLITAGCAGLYFLIPKEYAPKEDRGAFFILVNGPEGASFEYISDYMDHLENQLMSYVDSGEIQRLLVRAPRSFGNPSNFNDGIIIIVLSEFGSRRNGFQIMQEIRGKFSNLPGVRVFPIMRQGFSGRTQKPVQFVLGGQSYEKLADWRDIVLEKINQNNPGLLGLDHDYKETKPQLDIEVNLNRAADLGVSNRSIGRTLETMLGSRQVTTFIDDGEEYDVIIEGQRGKQQTKYDVQNIYIRSENTGELIPLSNLVNITEKADASTLNRYNRIRSITLEANLKEGYSIGAALEFMEKIVRDNLPATASIDYKGESLSFTESREGVFFIFALSLILVFLVLAAQFENYIHPFVIVLTIPSTIFGAFLGLYLFGQSLNVYTEVAIIMMVGLTSKNGILIVEFINQLRAEGTSFDKAVLEASKVRLRPIVMTGITTLMGMLPLILATGAGAETRISIGVVVFSGVLFSLISTIFLVPAGYSLIARNTEPYGKIARYLEKKGL